jgi:hypothetical protein
MPARTAAAAEMFLTQATFMVMSFSKSPWGGGGCGLQRSRCACNAALRLLQWRCISFFRMLVWDTL